MSLPKELTTITPLSKTVALLMFILLPVIAFLYGMKFQQELTKQVPNTPIRGCTKELKICPDSTRVGRTGPNCEFTPCPAVQNFSEETFTGVITDLIYDCHFDGVCSVLVDDNNIIVIEGGLRPPEEQNRIMIGSLVGFDMNEDRKEEFIGKKVEVFAKKISENKYTLYGSENYYAKLESAQKDMFCGGIQGKICPNGYECQYEGNYPDARGTCVNIKTPR